MVVCKGIYAINNKKGTCIAIKITEYEINVFNNFAKLFSFNRLKIIRLKISM